VWRHPDAVRSRIGDETVGQGLTAADAVEIWRDGRAAKKSCGFSGSVAQAAGGQCGCVGRFRVVVGQPTHQAIKILSC
jgi:hypothetical protein